VLKYFLEAPAGDKPGRSRSGPADHILCGRLPVSSGLDFRGVSVVPAVFVVVTFPVNVGGKRAWVVASKPEASLMSVGSLNAVPRKLMPIGIPST